MAYRKPSTETETSQRLTIAEFLADAACSEGAPPAELIARMQLAKLEDERAAKRVKKRRHLTPKRLRLAAVAAPYLIASLLSLIAGVIEEAPVTAGIAATSTLAGSAYAVIRNARVSRKSSNSRAPARSGVFSRFGWRGGPRSGAPKDENV